MHRLAVAVVLSAFSAVAQNPPSSDPFAAALAQKSIAALTGGAPVSDVTLTGSATRIAGSDKKSGTVTLSVKGTEESRIDLALTSGTGTEIRSDTAGYPQGASVLNGATQQPWPTHNCWINASWFFPELSVLAETADPNQIFLYVGLERRNGISVHHLETYRYAPGKRQATTAFNQAMSTMEIYLDSVSLLPVAFAFNHHPDDDSGTNIAIEIDFSNYQRIQGILVPLRVKQLIWNGLALDVTITSANLNAGLSDSLFAIASAN
jgi:hypothetical protein